MHPDFGGSGGFAYLINFYLAKNLGKVTDIQEYFQSLRGLDDFDAEDGRAMGEALCIKAGESKVARVGKFFRRYKGLREMGEKHVWFECMITRVVENKLRNGGDVRTKLDCLSKREGAMIGAGLAVTLAINLTAEAAVDEWISR